MDGDDLSHPLQGFQEVVRMEESKGEWCDILFFSLMHNNCYPRIVLAQTSLRGIDPIQAHPSARVGASKL